MKYPAVKNNCLPIIISALLLLVGLELVAVIPVLAGPVSGSDSVSGAVVYEGVISVAPGGLGDGLMEIGYAGRDIAASGILNWRPLSVMPEQAVMIELNQGGLVLPYKAYLHARGGLKLGGVERDYWPSGSGASLWSEDVNNLFPINSSDGVNVLKGTWQLSGAALEVVGTKDNLLTLSNSYSDATALKLNSIYIGGNLTVTPRADGREILLVDRAADPAGSNPYRVWHAGNDGRNSGLDASKIDGIDVGFNYAGNIGGIDNFQFCAYVDVETSPIWKCVALQ